MTDEQAIAVLRAAADRIEWEWSPEAADPLRRALKYIADRLADTPPTDMGGNEGGK